MEIKRVLVIGAGQMGGGIVQVMAQSGIDVIYKSRKLETAQKSSRRNRKKPGETRGKRQAGCCRQRCRYGEDYPGCRI